MEACTGATEGTMEDILPTIMNAFSLNDTAEETIQKNSSDNTAIVRRRQHQRRSGSIESPSIRQNVERRRRRGRQEQPQPNTIENGNSGSTEGTFEDIIPSIMTALSFGTTSEESIRRNRSDNIASRRQQQQQQQQQQQRQLDSIETPSIQKTVESSHRVGWQRQQQQQQQQPNNIDKGYSGLTEGTFEDIIPSIMDAFLLTNESEVTIRRNRSDNTASRSQQQQQQRQLDSIEIPLARSKTMESSHWRRRQRQIDTEAEVTFLDAFPAIMDVCSLNGDEKSQTYEKISDFRSNDGRVSLTRTSHSNNNGSGNTIQIENGNDNTNNIPISSSIMNAFSIADERNTNETVNGHVFDSIRNVLSMDDDGTKETQNNGVVGNSMSQVYPFMRNVFSMNDIGMIGTQNSTIETLENGGRSALPSRRYEERGNSPQRKNKPTQKILVTRAYEVKEHYLESIFYISISAILGSIFRVYMARIFGLDCQYNHFNDFLIPLTSNICVTNDGQSEQTGGALFIDFPSNVFGSFLMGMITPRVDGRRARLPWLHRDHPLQRDEVFHASLGTGFCGCLTTFASWNTQMVVMLDGTYCELGSQVVTVLFGYLIGLMGASYGFDLGRQCGLWMYNYKHRDEEEVTSHRERGDVDDSCISESQDSLHNGVALPDEGVELVDDDNVTLQPVPSHLHKIPLFLTAVALLLAFIIGDVVNGIEFYKGMTLLWILSPVGSLLRWRLSNLNMKKKRRFKTNSLDWIPWGTLFANLIATVISACMEGLNNRYFSGANTTSTNRWVNATLFALKTGVAGSLSTVSTMVKESVLLTEDHPGKAKGHYYSILTCVSCCLFGLMMYSTTIRIHSEIG